MIVPGLNLKIYRETLSAINKKAAEEIQRYMWGHNYEIDEAFLEFVNGIATKYGEAAGALSAQFYDDTAEYWQGVENRRKQIAPAEPAEPPTEDEVAKTVYGTLKESADKIPDAVSRLVKRTAEDTTLQNAIRDGAEFAWIPQGDTCPFCLMLASNGWQRASKKALKNGHAEHIHANCDCTYAVSFNGKPSYPGYDPEKYKEMYDNAEGDTWQEKLNFMRRDDYAVNADQINEQKRAAYARRAEKKRLQEEMKHGTIYGDRDYVFAAKEPGDASKPVGLHGDYQDFKELDISEDTRKTLRELNGLAIETNEEHGLAVYQGGKTDIQTNHDHNRVTIYYPKNAKHVEIYHCHTDDSVLSLEDIFESATKLNVDRECVISVNGDVWMIDYSEGIRPGEEEFKRAYKMCNDGAKLALEEDPAFNNWEFEERYYMLGRETMLRVARLFEWNIMGGDING